MEKPTDNSIKEEDNSDPIIFCKQSQNCTLHQFHGRHGKKKHDSHKGQTYYFELALKKHQLSQILLLTIQWNHFQASNISNEYMISFISTPVNFLFCQEKWQSLLTIQISNKFTLSISVNTFFNNLPMMSWISEWKVHMHQ